MKFLIYGHRGGELQAPTMKAYWAGIVKKVELEASVTVFDARGDGFEMEEIG